MTDTAAAANVRPTNPALAREIVAGGWDEELTMSPPETTVRRTPPGRWAPAWYGPNDVEIQNEDGVTIIIQAPREREGMKLQPATAEARHRALAVAQRIADQHNAQVRS